VRRLVSWHVSQHLQQEHPRQRLRHSPERLGKPERTEAQRHLVAILEAYEALSDKRRRWESEASPGGRLASSDSWTHTSRELPEKATDKRGGTASDSELQASPRVAPITPGLHGPSAPPVRLQLCSYCDQPYDVAAAEDAVCRDLSALTHGEVRAEKLLSRSFLSQLCPQHRHRALGLESFIHHGGLRVARAGDEPERRGQARSGVCCSGGGRRSRPWEGWLRAECVPRPTERPLQEQAFGTRAKHETRSLDVTSVESGCELAAHRSEEAVSMRATASDTVDPRAAATPLTRSSVAEAAVSAGEASTTPCGLQRLWSYAFPHAAPPAPEARELGLPAWWLETLEALPPPPQEVATLPPGMRSRGREQRVSNHARRRSSVNFVHARTPSSHSHESRPPGSPHKESARGLRSIFHGDNSRQVMEEILGSGGRDMPSPIARTLHHRRVRSVAF